MLPESPAPIEAQLAPVARNTGVACSRFCSLLERIVLAVRLVLSLPIGLVLTVGIGALVLLMFLQLLTPQKKDAPCSVQRPQSRR